MNLKKGAILNKCGVFASLSCKFQLSLLLPYNIHIAKFSQQPTKFKWLLRLEGGETEEVVNFPI